jgi:dihydrofolate synthase/folylpolyglutamate synthase
MRPSIGRFLPRGESGSGRAFAVLGAKLKQELYGDSSPLGERVRIGGRPISEREAARRIEELRADERLPPLSFFEYTTLLAFEAFRDAECEIVVLEVGLGGRLDSTNIVTPEVSVITNISF